MDPRVLRIVAPPHRVKYPATMAEVHPGDVVEFVDPPVYALDPHTMHVTTVLKQFQVKEA